MSRLMGWIRLLIGPAISAGLMIVIGFLYSWRLGVGAISIFAAVALAWVVLWLKQRLKQVEQSTRRLRTAVAVLRVVTYTLLALASPWTLAALLYRGPVMKAVLITFTGAVAIMIAQVIYWRLGGKTAI